MSECPRIAISCSWDSLMWSIASDFYAKRRAGMPARFVAGAIICFAGLWWGSSIVGLRVHDKLWLVDIHDGGISVRIGPSSLYSDWGASFHPGSGTLGFAQPSFSYSSGLLWIPMWIPFCLLASGIVCLHFKSRRSRKCGYCASCGYDLRGSLKSIKCPECGMPIPEEHKRAIAS